MCAKVYCNTCKYFEGVADSLRDMDKCKHPSNVIKHYSAESYRGPAEFEGQSYKHSPHTLNMGNACTNYRRRLSLRTWFEKDVFDVVMTFFRRHI